MKSKIILLITMCLFFSCTKKSVKTLHTEIEKVRLVPVGIKPSDTKMNVTIKCDPVTNKPIPVHQEFKSDNTSTALDLQDTILIIKITHDTVYVQLPCIDKTTTDESTTKKTVLPWWIYAIAVGLFLLGLGFLFIKIKPRII